MLNRKSAAVALLAALLLAACGSTPTRESTGEYFDDTTITAKVLAAFVADKQVKAADIAVETFKGTVQLSGFAGGCVETRAEDRHAEQISRCGDRRYI